MHPMKMAVLGVWIALLAACSLPLHAQVSTNNLLVWLKADSGVTVDSSGSNVVRWADQTVNANDATQTANTPGSQPTLVANALNGHSVLRFNSGDYLSLTNQALNLTNGLSIFIVAKNQDRHNYNGLFRIGPSGSPFQANSELELYWSQGTTDAGSGNVNYSVNRTTYPVNWGFLAKADAAPPVTSNYIVDVVASTAGTELRVNGSLAQGMPGALWGPKAVNWASIGVGYGGDGAADTLRGDFAEILIYNTGLSTNQRNAVYDYLNQTYFQAIPEPGVLGLMGLAGFVLLGVRGASRRASPPFAPSE